MVFIVKNEIRINMSKLAKKIASLQKEDWVSYMDTYRQITREEILQKDKAGFDLIQLANNGQHVRFEWEKRTC
jgi:hypothetical protein